MSSERPARILPVIVVSQLAGTSLWFAGNAVLPDLQARFDWPAGTLGHMTSAVQLGFIAGTLVFALLAISDRYSPRATFLACALLGAASNGCSYFLPGEVSLLLLTRLATGFFLAGIYPVGMKIASGWYRHDLGKALGYPGRCSRARHCAAASHQGARPRAAVGRGHAQRIGNCRRRRADDVRAGAGRSVPRCRCEVRPGLARDHLQVGRLSCLLIRLLRPHVGALRVLGVRAASRDRVQGAHERRRPQRVAAGVRHDRRGCARLCCGRVFLPALRQRPGSARAACGIGSVLPPLAADVSGPTGAVRRLPRALGDRRRGRLTAILRAQCALRPERPGRRRP